MRQILTVTLNPAVDVSASVAEVVAGPKLRAEGQQIDPGGGGVNVSRAILRLGGTSDVFVATAGVTGRLLVEMLREEGIEPVTFETGGLTRQSFAVTETSRDRQFRFVMPGPVWDAALAARLLERLEAVLQPGQIVVASGSLPPGVAPDFYRDIGARVRRAGAAFVLDTSGPALEAAVRQAEAPAHLLRLDGEEAAALAGEPFEAPEALADFAGRLIAEGAAERVVLALGERGSVGVSAAERVFCTPPRVRPVSSVGAGDSLLAAVTLALARGEGLADATRRGTAAAASAVTTPATQLCDRAQTEAFVEKVAVSRI